MAKYDDELIKQMKQEGKTWIEIGEALNVNSETLRTYTRRQGWYKDIKEADPHVAEEGMEYSKNEQGIYQIDKEFLFDEEKLFSNEELLKMNNLDPNEFELLRIRRGKWSVTIKDGQRKWNFQSRIDAKPRDVKGVDYKAIGEFLSKRITPKEPAQLPDIQHEDNYLVKAVYDPHFGNSTLEDYDNSLGKDFRNFEKGYKEILIIAGGDLLHNDNTKGMTASGTTIDKVDMNQAWEDCYDYFDLLISKAYENSEKVTVKYIPGNHDEFSGWTVIKALKRWYEAHESIEIDDTQQMFKAYLLGHNFIGMTHGDKSNLNKYPMIFATNYAKYWGADNVITREAFIGHKHFEETIDKDGLLIRRMPTRNKADQWHIDNGFNTTHKKFISVEYDEYESIGYSYQ